jgi:hypothetical protein
MMVHRAGTAVHGIQRCSDCGEVLLAGLGRHWRVGDLLALEPSLPGLLPVPASPAEFVAHGCLRQKGLRWTYGD